MQCESCSATGAYWVRSAVRETPSPFFFPTHHQPLESAPSRRFQRSRRGLQQARLAAVILYASMPAKSVRKFASRQQVSTHLFSLSHRRAVQQYVRRACRRYVALRSDARSVLRNDCLCQRAEVSAYQVLRGSGTQSRRVLLRLACGVVLGACCLGSTRLEELRERSVCASPRRVTSCVRKR